MTELSGKFAGIEREIRRPTARNGRNPHSPGTHNSRRIKRIFAVSAAILLTGCTTVPIYGDIPECERLIPASLKAPVPGVPIPDSEEAEPWMQAFIGQTGQLEKANERGPAIDHIYTSCLEMHRRALQRSRRGFFGRLFG